MTTAIATGHQPSARLFKMTTAASTSAITANSVQAAVLEWSKREFACAASR
jgi:hypothetical protein